MSEHVTRVLTWFDNRDNVTFAIAVAAFAMSVYNFVAGIVRNFLHIKIEIPEVFHAQNMAEASDVLNLKILNCSYSPVIISRIKVSSSLGAGDYGRYRRKILRIEKTVNGNSVSCDQWFSDRLPVRIDGKSFADILIVPNNSAHRIPAGEKLTVELYTSKKLIKKRITANAISPYQLLSQCRAPEK